MAVIKSIRADRLTHDAVVLDLGDLKRQADAIMREARDEARRIVEQGRDDARKLTNAADARGYSQGLERGRLDGAEAGRQDATKAVLAELQPQIEALLAKWTQAVERWERSRGDMLMNAQEDVLAFACALASKIIHRTIQSDPLIIRDQLAEALSLLSRPTGAVVRINPDDRAILDLALPGILAAIEGAHDMVLRDDPAISRGGCIVATEGGQIDATIEKQLCRIVEALLPTRAAAEPLRRIDAGDHDDSSMP
jgi:flagellar biosynthesis/type III secretory pathway protein FliH